MSPPKEAKAPLSDRRGSADWPDAGMAAMPTRALASWDLGKQAMRTSVATRYAPWYAEARLDNDHLHLHFQHPHMPRRPSL